MFGSGRKLILVAALFQATWLSAEDAPQAHRRPPRVYRTSVRPHWSSDHQRFWYRNDLRGDEREFIVVNASQGTRESAFDHQQVAEALARELGQPISAANLPIDALEFEGGETLRLTGPNGTWQYRNRDASLTRVEASAGTGSLPFNRQPRPTRRTGTESEIRFENRLRQAVDIHWLDSSGDRNTYAHLEPGGTHAQHTYAGHVWLVTKDDNEIVAVFEAESQPATAIIDSREPDSGNQRRGRRRDPRRRAAESGRSPDEQFEVFARDDNLWVRQLEEDQQTQLTTDGSPADTWRRDVARARGLQLRYTMPDPPPRAVEAYWSPDSRFVVAIRTQTAAEPRVHIIESSPEDATRPKLHWYPYFKPGDELPLQRPALFDVANCRRIEIDSALFPNPFSISNIRWAQDSSRFTFRYNQRGHQVVRIIRVDAATGEAMAVVNEQAETFVDYAGKLFAEHIDETGELIWMSERDGWNHLYLYDTPTCQLKHQITRGPWVVRGVERVDPEQRQIWFRAGGIHPHQDPYHVHYARVDFDGSGMVLLTEGDGTHEIEFSPDRSYFIDKWSRVDLPPIHDLRRSSDGSLVCRLERADATEILTSGRRLPERFAASGRDDQTKVFGIAHWPIDFDPTRKEKYPIVENIYAGPHSAHVPKRFRASYSHQQEIADRGFVVVQIDGMGTSHRSKEFHDVCWRNIGDAGFPDRVRWIHSLARKYTCLDTSRIGIYGGSAGGQNALRALLAHGDFYRVAVADCGCHDNRMDKLWWNELWMGWPVDSHYDEQSNVTNAHKLSGQLLLIVGELDRNVDPASTMQVVSALIKADKDFDLLVVPGGGHGIAESTYGRRRRVDFFVEHLKPHAD